MKTMENHKKSSLFPNLLFSTFTSIAKTSNIMCPNHLWQEPKIPECMLEKERQAVNK